MEKFKVSFVANNQQLTATGTKHASDTYADIEATFALGERWTDMDSVSAVWWNDFTRIATVLDSEGKCTVPHEVLMRKGCVRVNLVGSVVENGELVTRLTSYSAEAVHVNEKIKLTGNEPQTITPSQYEQFVENVKADADRAESARESAQDASASAQGYAQSASASASSASESATSAEQSATASARDAQTVSEIAVEVEVMKNEAELARDEILGMSAEAVTLPAGSEATASYADGLLSLGIPRGNTGATGAKGDRGDTGATPNLTIGTVETLEPTQDAYVTRRGTDDNPIFDFGIPKGDTGEVTMSQLSALLPTDTASGSIASFPDGQSVIPMVSLLADIEPIQDLHGYDKPWAGGAGKNVLPFYSNGESGIGLTLSYDEDDDAYILNGTTTGTGNVLLSVIPSIGWEQGETYNISVEKISGSMTIGEGEGITYAISLFSSNLSAYIRGSNLRMTDIVGYSGYGSAFDATNSKLMLQSWRIGTVFNNLKFRVQIEKGNTATSWTPYSNICPISGHTEVNTHRTGKNLLDNNGLSDYTTWESLGSSNYAKPLNLPKDTQVTISGQHTVPSGMNSYVYLQRFDGTDWQNIRTLWQANVSSMPYTFTTDDSSYRLRAYNPSASIATIDWMQIELGSTATAYEPFNGTTYTTPLGRTVYGGTLDVVSGELSVTHALVDLGDLTWAGTAPNFYATAVTPQYKWASDNVMYCDTYAFDGSRSASPWYGENGTLRYYKSGVTPTCELYVRDERFSSIAEMQAGVAGVKLCYPLATPQTYQLDPQTIDLLLGDNNVWTDSGAVEVVYRADVGLYIDKKLN